MNRTAPAGGYVGGTKRHYRRNIWAAFRRDCPVPVHRAQALLMPTAEGDEVRVALNNGFREENLHLVDKNAAIAAHLKRRFPKSTCYGVLVSRAAKRIARAGIELDVANLDLCGKVTGPTYSELRQFVASGVVRDRGLVAVTLLRGRELAFNEIITDGFFHAGASCSDEADRGRMARLRFCIIGTSTPCDGGTLGFDAEVVRYDRYRSTAGTQTMLWAALRLSKKFFSFAECAALDEEYRKNLLEFNGAL